MAERMNKARIRNLQSAIRNWHRRFVIMATLSIGLFSSLVGSMNSDFALKLAEAAVNKGHTVNLWFSGNATTLARKRQKSFKDYYSIPFDFSGLDRNQVSSRNLVSAGPTNKFKWNEVLLLYDRKDNGLTGEGRFNIRMRGMRRCPGNTQGRYYRGNNGSQHGLVCRPGGPKRSGIACRR
ncbi:MAG: hypothetical protein QME81_15605 [bacterium]|nr:hypothetical protein [bacterium]